MGLVALSIHFFVIRPTLRHSKNEEAKELFSLSGLILLGQVVLFSQTANFEDFDVAIFLIALVLFLVSSIYLLFAD